VIGQSFPLSPDTAFPEYGVGSGLYAIRAGVTWEHQFDKHWSHARRNLSAHLICTSTPHEEGHQANDEKYDEKLSPD
jgi:hypothetical protein